MKRTIALLLCLFTLFTTVQMSAFAVPATVLTQAASAPAQVKNVKATAGSGSVALTWSKVSGKVTYVVYEYNSSTKKYTQKGSTTSTKYTVKNLKSSKTYAFAVRAYAKSGSKTLWGKMSAVVSVKTTKPVTVSKVSGLKITTAGKSGTLKLSWKSQGGVTGFQVYRSTSGKTGSYKKIASLKSSQVSYTDTGLKNSTPYYYAVRAYKKTVDGYTFGSFVKVNLSTKLTASFIKKQVEKANSLYMGWVIGLAAAESFNWSDRVVKKSSYDTVTYCCVKSTKFKTKKAIKNALATYFGGDVQKRYCEMIDSNYIDHNGKLYGREELGQGGDIEINRLYLKNVKANNTSCTFTISGYCSDYTSYTESENYALYYRNGKWLYSNYPVFTNMSMYYGHTKWMN